MFHQKILSECNNELQKELIKLFHSSNLPLHFNKTGNKEFTNYHRISIIILFRRSKKSLRDFVNELTESKWIYWLGLKKFPKKSTLHDWIKMFKMKTIRQLLKLLQPKETKLTAIDGTGFDSWQRSNHYEKRVGEAHLPHMPYAKADLFIDVKTRKIIDFSLMTKRVHDAKVAKKIFKRNKLKNIIILADRGYDGEPLHELVREKGGIMYAPVRKMCKSLKIKPRGRFRKGCLNLPDFMGQRSIIEAINFSLKSKQITALRSKNKDMKQKEFGWHVILYNIRMNISNKEGNSVGEANKLGVNFFLLKIEIYVIPDNAFISKHL
jgi:hypothetical protein